MADDEHERIARKAYEIWESEGHPHGREQSHWDQAKEIIALHDGMGDTLLPRNAGSFEPEEPTQSVEAYGDVPGLTDQGRDDLTDTDREPEITKPLHATHSLGDTAGHVARGRRDEDPDIDEPETVTPSPKVAAVTPTPSNPTLGVPAPREAAKTAPDLDAPQAIVPKTASVPPSATASAPGLEIGSVGAATSGKASNSAPSGLPPTAVGAGRAPGAPDDARLGSGLQASPAGNSAPVTGKNPPKSAAAAPQVTKGKPPQGRR